MPNLCTNTLTINGSDEKVDKVLSFISSVDDKGIQKPIDFNKIIPMPDNIDRGSRIIEPGDNCDPTFWYDWSVSHWGTKWNAYDPELISHGVIKFDTAWAPPIPVIIELSKLFPEVKITIAYCSEDDISRYDTNDYQNGYLTQENTKYDVELIKILNKSE